jgi:hypothetical protein
MPFPRLIAFCGERKSGRTIATNFMTENYGYEEYALTGILHALCGALFLEDVDNFIKPELKTKTLSTYNATPEAMLKCIGNNLFRQDIHKHLPNLNIKHGDFWLHRLKKWLADQPLDSKIIISGVHFSNEADFIKTQGGIVAYISDNNEHITEVETNIAEEINYSVIIPNVGTKDEFFANIELILDRPTPKDHCETQGYVDHILSAQAIRELEICPDSPRYKIQQHKVI